MVCGQHVSSRGALKVRACGHGCHSAILLQRARPTRFSRYTCVSLTTYLSALCPKRAQCCCYFTLCFLFKAEKMLRDKVNGSFMVRCEPPHPAVPAWLPRLVLAMPPWLCLGEIGGFRG